MSAHPWCARHDQPLVRCDHPADGGLPEITEVQRVTLKPGDRLAVRVAGRITPQQADMIRQRVMATWPGVPVLILDDSASLEVIETQEAGP
jgi:hypothetical protein